MKLKIILFSLALSFLSVIAITAQQTYMLDLQKSIEIAKEQSYDMLMLGQDLMIAKYNLKAATNKFKTSIDLNLTAPNYEESIASWDTGGVTSYYANKELNYSSTLVVNQPLPTDGNVYIRSGFYNTDDYYVDTNYMYVNTRIGLSQPISAFYAYNNIQAEFKKAKLNHELSQKELVRTELDLVYNVSQAFYSVLSAKEQMNISKLNLEKQQQAHETASNKYNAGLISESEALQMEIDLGAAQNEYNIAIFDYESKANYLKEKLGLEMHDSITIIGDFEYDELLVDVEKAVQLGLDNRLEIREREIQIELSDITIKKRKAERLPSGEISAYYDFIGVGYDNLGTPAFDNAFNDLQDRPANRGVALNINIPILDWGVNKSLQRVAEASKQKQMYALDLEKVQIEREIRNTVNQLHNSLNRLHLLEKNVKLAERNFEISRARFTNGDLDAQGLALDRSRLTNAQNSRLDAYIRYKLLIADLARKTFYDFEKNVALTN